MRASSRLRRLSATFAITLWLASCAETEEPTPSFDKRELAVQAYCTATVEMTPGDSATRIEVDVETNYIPRVVMCENGGADFEALKAQAVAARTFLYYKLTLGGYVRNGTVDQLYSSGATSGHCPLSRTPSQAHLDAAAQTAGQVIMWGGVVICSFYVAGAIPSTTDCVAATNDNDPTSTEKWVTYNWGQSGTDVTQTPLGWVSPTNKFNRGCNSQNGANCLSKKGWNYPDILRFYYGMDIDISTATGSCITPAACTPRIDADEVIIDDRDSCFQRSASTTWHEQNAGHDAHLYWTYVWDQQPDCIGTWQLDFANAGRYELDVWIEPIAPLSTQAPYLLRHAGQESSIVLSQQGASGWLSLGHFDFAAGTDQFLRVSDATGEKYTDTNGKRIVFDALRVRKYVPPAEPDPVEEIEEIVDQAEMPLDEPDLLEPDVQELLDDPIELLEPNPEPTPDDGLDADLITNPDAPSELDNEPSDPSSRVQSSGGCACSARSNPKSTLPLALLLLTVLPFRRALRRRR